MTSCNSFCALYLAENTYTTNAITCATPTTTFMKHHIKADWWLVVDGNVHRTFRVVLVVVVVVRIEPFARDEEKLYRSCSRLIGYVCNVNQLFVRCSRFEAKLTPSKRI